MAKVTADCGAIAHGANHGQYRGEELRQCHQFLSYLFTTAGRQNNEPTPCFPLWQLWIQTSVSAAVRAKKCALSAPFQWLKSLRLIRSVAKAAVFVLRHARRGPSR